MSARKGTKPPNAGKGRPRGSPNKATATVRDVFSHFVEGNAGQAQVLFDRVAKDDPAKALDLLIRLAEFCIPKLARVEGTGPGGENLVDVRVSFVDSGPR